MEIAKNFILENMPNRAEKYTQKALELDYSIQGFKCHPYDNEDLGLCQRIYERQLLFQMKRLRLRRNPQKKEKDINVDLAIKALEQVKKQKSDSMRKETL